MRIQNNPTAFNVWSSYSSNVTNLRSSMGKLSTGLIRNTDDPAGIGISERMRAQIKGTAQARNNVENATSLVQTADAWLQKVNDMLSRMKALSIEASGIMGETDRNNVRSEFKALQDEVVRITSKNTAAAKFNGLYLFRGGDGLVDPVSDTLSNPAGKIKVQIGADNEQTIELSLKDLSIGNTNNIGTTYYYGYSTNGEARSVVMSQTTWASIINASFVGEGGSVIANGLSATSNGGIGKIDLAINYVANARATMASQQKRLEYTGEGLLTYEDNLRAAESKIRDVDMARESTDFTKYQILTNASNAMLVQANQLPQGVLQLLG